MATVRSIPRKRRLPSLRNAVMIDTVRGVLRVRKWPKKRGTPKSALQRWHIDWFKQANLLAKYADGMTQARAIALTKYTGLYPRDIMLKAMRGRLYWLIDQDGNRWYPMAGIQDISDTLDVLAQAVGSVLVRAVDRWRPAGPPAPTIGHALTYQGPALPPIWAAAGAGVPTQPLPGTPIAVDDTVINYVFDVTGYATVEFLLHDIVFAASDNCKIRVSTDGGLTYKSGATSYATTLLTSTSEAAGHATFLSFGMGAGTLVHNCMGRFSNLRAGRGVFTADVAYGTTAVGRRANYMHFDGPITHVKLFANSGNNFKTGTIQAIGTVAA